jgi:hypothetical protein
MHCLHIVLFYRLRENCVLSFGNKSYIKAIEFLRSTNRYYFQKVHGARTAQRDVARRRGQEEEEKGVGDRMRPIIKYFGTRKNTVQVPDNRESGGVKPTFSVILNFHTNFSFRL